MDSLDLIRRFHSVLPIVREWIEKTLEEYKEQAVPVIKLGFSRLEGIFPTVLLDKAKTVVVAGKVPFPPLSQMGLPEFTLMENMRMAGVTYKDTFFVGQPHRTESLHFHELVHVVQWERLGFDNFLLAYGVRLMQFGYQDSPLEKMAYFLQTRFDRGLLPENIIAAVQQETDAIWSSAASLISKAGLYRLTAEKS